MSLILLAEDNAVNQCVALGALRQLGLQADAVADGAAAVRALETIPYDLVLLDVQMPVMDGLEAARRIRDPHSAVLNHRIPVIAMTAGVMADDRERCLAAGMDDYVSKPVSRQALAEVLTKWLPGRRKGDAAAPAAGAAVPPPRAPSEALVFNRAALLTRLLDDEDLVRAAVAAFLQDIPQQLAALQGHLRNGDAAGVQRQAHTIKGAAANVGADRLRQVAAEMERAARAGDVSAAEGHMAALEAAFAALRQAMHDGQ